jgi:putative ABC transport system permease protein
MIAGMLIEGLIYGIMVLSVLITFRILNFADMTVDGSFPLGAAVMAMSLRGGIPWPSALGLAFLCGAGAGLVTALIHTRLKIPDLLSGILTMTMLYSVNLRIMGNRANVSLIRIPTFFSWASDLASDFGGGIIPAPVLTVIFCFLIVLFIKLALDLFFHTDFGLSLEALGTNPQMIVSQGMNPDLLKICGISLANGLTGISGGLAAMYQGFADVNLGQGMIVLGLASLMIGEFLIRSNRIFPQTLRALFGSILYRSLMVLARNYGYRINMTANDLKLITGLLIILCIIISKHSFRGARARLGARVLPAAKSAIRDAAEGLSDFVKTRPFDGGKSGGRK